MKEVRLALAADAQDPGGSQRNGSAGRASGRREMERLMKPWGQGASVHPTVGWRQARARGKQAMWARYGRPPGAGSLPEAESGAALALPAGGRCPVRNCRTTSRTVPEHPGTT